MIKAGIIGMGGMGHMHFGVYDKISEASVVAVADIDEDKLRPGDSTEEINIGGGDASLDPDRQQLYTDPDELIADDEVELVDVCLPTYLHAEMVVKALNAGKNVLCEKPMAMNFQECQRMLEAADRSDGMLMIAHCIRFWPEYAYLKETVDSGRLGKVCSAEFWRGGPAPTWSWEGWLEDSCRSGGAILDLHIHDADFIQYLFGSPPAVCSSGAVGHTGGIDMINTLYLYDAPMTVHSGSSQGLPESVGFEMKYAVAFEKGVVTFSSKDSPTLSEYSDAGTSHPEVKDSDGYTEEIRYFASCIEKGEAPAMCTPESAATSIQLVMAEEESVQTGQTVSP